MPSASSSSYLSSWMASLLWESCPCLRFLAFAERRLVLGVLHQQEEFLEEQGGFSPWPGGKLVLAVVHKVTSYEPE
jgi:hypothetical protein